jgi:hypothetical protein
MLFYVGLDHVSDAKHFDRAFISINAIRGRKSDLAVNDWIMDSGEAKNFETKVNRLIAIPARKPSLPFWMR